HRLAGRGFLFGGSTGTVVSGATRWLAEHGASELCAVAIAADLGERYLDTLYQRQWIECLYGDVLGPDELADGVRLPEPSYPGHHRPADPVSLRAGAGTADLDARYARGD